MKSLLLSLCLLFSHNLWAKLELQKTPPLLELQKDLGGKVSGEAWSSQELKGKVHVLFYVDPDEDKLNDHVAEALKAANFPKDKYHSVGVVNMQATWIPNLAIESKLKTKQEAYPDVTYVKDFEKVFVSTWGLEDHSNSVVALNKEGKVIFHKDGKLTEEELQTLLDLIKQGL